MASVGANNKHAPFAPHDLAVFADALDARSNFHRLAQFGLSKASQYSDLGIEATRAGARVSGERERD
jgi:hypothetical protein